MNFFTSSSVGLTFETREFFYAFVATHVPMVKLKKHLVNDYDT